VDVLEAIKERRSIRRYKEDPVPQTVLYEVLEAARWAPSWANTQCWRFIVVSDTDVKNRLAELFAYNRSAQAIRQSPVIIVTCAEVGHTGFIRGERIGAEDWYMFDTALDLENLKLAARAAGLGTVQVGNFDAAQVSAMLEVPEGFRVIIMTLLGYPDEVPAPPERKPLRELVYLERFGEPLII
jgi:nitroreductase